jgi:TRAP-type uncharacterized transport system substrate-binding protein
MAQQIKITQTSNADMNIGVPKNLTMAQQTAVEWFEKNISKYISYHYDKAYEEHDEVTKIYEQAKAMEKEQIVKAYISADLMEGRANLSDAEQYYTETYQSNQYKPNN